MRSNVRFLGLVLTFAIGVSVPGASLVSTVAAIATCPIVPPIGSTVNGGLIVTGTCILNYVTVKGGIMVTTSGRLELENSYVTGGIEIDSGGELDSGHTLGSNFPTNNPSSIKGGIKFHGRDLDLYNATISGEVLVDGNGPGGEPAICGSNLSGGVTVKNITTEAFVGDPGEFLPSGCAGNLIEGSVHVIDSPGLVEIESNTLTGSVILENSTIVLAGNTIGGSVQCRNVAFLNFVDATPNTVRGAVQCP